MPSAALAAALEVATGLDLDASDAVVLRDVGSTVVHLRPSPVIARVVAEEELAAVRRELGVTSYLAASGAPVAPPSADPGPHERNGHVVTLWQHVDHDPQRPLDGAAAGRALRRIHDLLAGHAVEGLPHFARLDEVRAIVASVDVPAAEAEDLAAMVALAEKAVVALDVPLQPVHGDAWLGNVLRTPDGPVWSDFDKVCLGPRELDLACNETAARQRGRTPEDDALLAGYGDHDRAALERAAALELVPLTAWTYRLAARRPEYADSARHRLALALDGLRSPPSG